MYTLLILESVAPFWRPHSTHGTNSSSQFDYTITAMTSEGLVGSTSSSPLDPSDKISVWLSSLHLPQYATSFAQAGYHTLADCRALDEEKLLQVSHFPTGHRRRILHNLEVLKAGDNHHIDGSEMDRVTKKPVPFPRTIFLKEGKRVTPSQNPQTNTGYNNRFPGSHTLPTGTCKKKWLQHDADFISTVSHTLPRTHHNVPLSGSKALSMAGSNKSLSLSSHSLPSDWENFLKDLSASTPSIAQTVSGVTDEGCSVGFQGEMVDNDIYESSQFTDLSSRPTRSYKLRHRPVPEIPLLDWYVVAQYTASRIDLKPFYLLHVCLKCIGCVKIPYWLIVVVSS